MDLVGPPWPPDRLWFWWPPGLLYHGVSALAGPFKPAEELGNVLGADGCGKKYTGCGHGSASPSGFNLDLVALPKWDSEAAELSGGAAIDGDDEQEVAPHHGTAASASILVLAEQPLPGGGQSKGQNICEDDEYDEDAAMWANSQRLNKAQPEGSQLFQAGVEALEKAHRIRR